MAKDPAINWYFDNWGGGTKTMSRFLKGCYMDLLDAQFHSGHLSLDEIKHVLGADFSAWQTLQKKFKQDVHGNYYSERLDHEILKREKNSKQQSEKVKKRWDLYHSIYNGNTDVLPNNGNGIETGSFGKSENLLTELTKIEIGNTIEFVFKMKQVRLTTEKVLTYWEAFILNAQEPAYHTREKKIQHFRNWVKNQIEKPKEPSKKETKRFQF